ncbi:MAG: hypothetical protein IPJ58_13605 [Ardenticatenia bacterium]|nr:hypothetical protein [Ardenticatenia bacterium]
MTTETSKSAEVFRLLSQADWGTLAPRLVAFAEYWMNGYRQIRGVSGEDIAHTVVRKAFDGTRKWNPERGELYPWLCEQVKSEVSNLANSDARKREVLVSSDEDDEALDPMAGRGALHQDDDPALMDPEDILLDRDASNNVRRRVDALYRAVNDRPELIVVLEAIIDGCEPKSRFLAGWLAIPGGVVDNRLRALRRSAARIEEL